MRFRFALFSTAVLLATLPPVPARAGDAAPAAEGHRPRPVMRDFIGLTVHTVQFKPDLYAPVCRELRDYHPINWDFGGDTSRPQTFPTASNGVDWNQLYGTWTKAGFDVDACAMFDDLPADKWKNSARDARAYGESFAKYFGPSAGRGIVSSVEIGNEPAKYKEGEYRTIFEAMARGIRTGDPKLKIATCAVMTGKPDQWSKPMSAIAGLEPLYDVLNVHSYPFKEKWPTWRRSFPEDPSIEFLKAIEDVARWRDEHAAGKQIWLTEFGYDSASKPPSPAGEWKQWVGVTDEQQARYIVRSFLVLSAMNVDRAYLYFFNDKDEAQLHGASGITRNFQPKQSFYAMAQLYRNLADYRFERAVKKMDGECYCFEYVSPGKPKERVFVAWSPTGSDRKAKVVLPIGVPAALGTYRTEQMTTDAAAPKKAEWKNVTEGVEVELGESPVYFWAH
jgi:serine/threonine-protein kinase ATR